MQDSYNKLLGERALLEERFGMPGPEQDGNDLEAGVLSSFDAKQERLQATLEGEHNDKGPTGGGSEAQLCQLDASLLSVLARFATEWNATVAQLQLNV